MQSPFGFVFFLFLFFFLFLLHQNERDFNVNFVNQIEIVRMRCEFLTIQKRFNEPEPINPSNINDERAQPTQTHYFSIVH